MGRARWTGTLAAALGLLPACHHPPSGPWMLHLMPCRGHIKQLAEKVKEGLDSVEGVEGHPVPNGSAVLRSDNLGRPSPAS